MTPRILSEFMSLWVAALMLVTICISMPFSVRELRHGWTALRGQFGLALCLISFGIAIFLLTRWVYLQREPPMPFWDHIRPITLFSLCMMAAGCLLAIRAMTVTVHPHEWLWIGLACTAFSLTMMVVF